MFDMSDPKPEDSLDPDLMLSDHTLNALKEFLSENSSRLHSEDNTGHIEENWVIFLLLNDT